MILSRNLVLTFITIYIINSSLIKVYVDCYSSFMDHMEYLEFCLYIYILYQWFNLNVLCSWFVLFCSSLWRRSCYVPKIELWARSNLPNS